jgi:hypothetical protein
MRRILVENARHKRSAKKGGQLQRAELHRAGCPNGSPATTLRGCSIAGTRCSIRRPAAGRPSPTVHLRSTCLRLPAAASRLRVPRQPDFRKAWIRSVR